jgi:lipopolysaccharide export system permease protein
VRSINTINKYIFRELFFPFLSSLFFLTFVFLMSRIPEITNMVMNYNVPVSSVLVLLGFKLPRFLEFTIPMSVTISILLTFMRMSGENEILALKASGSSLYKLLPPVLTFCVLGTILSLLVTIFVMPWAKTSFKLKSIEFAQSSIDMALQERQFNAQVDDLMIYVAHVDVKTHGLEDIVIEDRRTKGVVSISTAPSGKIISSENKQVYTIRLYDGAINQVKLDEGSVNNIKFGGYDIVIDLDAMNKNIGNTGKRIDERSLGDLVQFIRSGIKNQTKLNEALMELHEKFSVPFACLALGLLSFPLGVQSSSTHKSSGLGLGLFFFLLYYLLLATGWSVGESGAYPPFLGMWMPNVVLGSAGIYLLIRNVKDRPVQLPKFMVTYAHVLKRSFTKKS